MNIILLEAPAASWLGIALTIIVGLLSFLARDAYNELKRKVQELHKYNEKTADVVIEERNRSDQEMRAMDLRINALHLNILSKLDEIKDKFSELRK